MSPTSFVSDAGSAPSRPQLSTFGKVNLAAALCDPYRGRQTDFFTRDWGDEFIVPGVTIGVSGGRTRLVSGCWLHFVRVELDPAAHFTMFSAFPPLATPC
jgi:hypothetical protein